MLECITYESGTKLTSATDIWVDDALSRSEYAKHWTDYLIKRSERAPGSITVALDASWGAGKSFFIERWSEMLKTEYPVVTFDAWKNDQVEDPIIAFMSELTGSIQTLKTASGISPPLQDKLSQTSKRLVSSIGKAVVPTFKVVGKQALKKLSGIDLNELADVIDDPSSLGDLLEDSQATRQEINQAMEVFFAQTLTAYRQRAGAISEVQAALRELVELLGSSDKLRAPLFVFIDELDRCRPSFAVRLLEEIKHIFGVNGVVFILAVNSVQLAKSVGALYGAGFDGHGYLQRFFDVQLMLPRPSLDKYLEVLQKRLGVIPEANIFWAGIENYGPSGALRLAFTRIADAFSLTLRQQENVYSAALIAAEFVGRPVHTYWLFFLAALKYRDPELFAEYEKEPMKGMPLDKLPVTQSVAKISVTYGQTRAEIRLVDLISEYSIACQLTIRELGSVVRELEKRPADQFTGGLIAKLLISEAAFDIRPTTTDGRNDPPVPYRRYIAAVSCCGSAP
ncbi:KAP family P-loop NTPase fold protein [Ramlibacter sp. MMS24-I3-19]|uniref:KAP family P-loop NTPase fold protein n=1 Tax=Ramlibacter sp. MMS24-I3-19 TaxID=3416606 RepID=UPI003D06B9C9